MKPQLAYVPQPRFRPVMAPVGYAAQQAFRITPSVTDAGVGPTDTTTGFGGGSIADDKFTDRRRPVTTPVGYGPLGYAAALPRYGKSSGVFAPSGALTQPQILDLQGALVATGNAPASAITGRMPIGTAAQLRSFQTNYNGEQATRGYRYAPRTLTVDGQWGPATQQALTNYIPFARSVLASRGISAAQVDGVGGAAGGTIAGVYIEPLGSTPGGSGGKTPTQGLATSGNKSPGMQGTPAVQPSPSSSAPPLAISPAPQTASTFPLVPVLAIGGGLAAVGLALYVRSQRRKGK